MMRRKLAVVGLAAAIVAGALSFTAISTETTQAATAGAATFIVPANDGYGIADCVASGCGQVVADAWCEAQGFAASESFGPAEVEVTGSIATGTRPISVTCKN